MYSVRKQRMEYQFDGPTVGQYPHKFTHDERFQYRVKVQPVAGRLEFSIRCADTRMAAMAAEREWMGFPKRGAFQSIAKDPEDSKRRAKLRAKGMVRLLALELGVDRMFTFTIRMMGEPVPYDTVLKAWDGFRRSMETHCPGFRYIATPERQKNGQWHIHAGTRGFLNINVLRRLWQASLNRALGRSQLLTTGPDSPGHVHVGNKGRLMGDSVRKATRIASYISKYIGKAMDAAFNRKKYFHSHGVTITPAQRQWLAAQSCDEALEHVLRQYGLVNCVEGVMSACTVPVWRRDACSAWFSIHVDDIPPPF
jgi:hypothetical protein